MHDILFSNCKHAIHDLLQNDSRLWLRQIAASCLNEFLKVHSVAKLHNQVVVVKRLRRFHELNHVLVFNFCQNLDFIHQIFVSFLSSNTSSVDDFYCIHFIRVIFQMGIVNCAKHASAESSLS